MYNSLGTSITPISALHKLSGPPKRVRTASDFSLTLIFYAFFTFIPYNLYNDWVHGLDFTSFLTSVFIILPYFLLLVKK